MSGKLKNLIRLHEWNVDEQRRKLGELLRLAGELENKISDLEKEVVHEQSVAKTSGDVNFTYGEYAKQVIVRRENLQHSLAQVEESIIEAREDLKLAYQELKKFEISLANQNRRELRERNRREQIVLDEVGANMHKRRRSSSY